MLSIRELSVHKQTNTHNKNTNKGDNKFSDPAPRHSAAAQGVDHQPCGALQTQPRPSRATPRSRAARHRA